MTSQCSWKTFMVHQTFVRWALYILLNLIRHFGTSHRKCPTCPMIFVNTGHHASFMMQWAQKLSWWWTPGIILSMCPANERWRYTVTPSLIGWAHTQNDLRKEITENVLITWSDELIQLYLYIIKDWFSIIYFFSCSCYQPLLSFTVSIHPQSPHVSYCPACRTTFIATRFRVAVICPIIPVPHCIRVFFYFVWFVFINHIFQFYYELCTYCNILDIYLS